MARLDEALRRTGPVCPQCEGGKTLKVPIVRNIQMGYRNMRIADYENITCGKCLGKGHT